MFIIKTLYKLLLTLNSTSLLLLVYLVKGGIWIRGLGEYSIIIYVICVLAFTKGCLIFTFILKNDNIEGGIEEISLANDSYMPSYLGYFFVALSIPDNNWTLFICIYAIIYLFSMNSQSLYFNPLFMLFGYNFYYINSKNHLKIFVISRQKNIRDAEELRFCTLKRINEFTFIDKERY